jgi:hypothetical protein
MTPRVKANKYIGYAELNVTRESPSVRDVSNLEQIVKAMK